MSRLGVAAALVAMALPGCRLPAGDDYALAVLAAENGDLATALARLDRVAPEHARAAEARSLAVTVQERMARALDLMHQGVALRGLGDDDGAVDCFRRALGEWAACEEAHQLLRLPAVPVDQLRRVVSRPPGADAAARVARLAAEPLPPRYGPEPEPKVAAAPPPSAPPAVAPAGGPLAAGPQPAGALPAGPGDVVPDAAARVAASPPAAPPPGEGGTVPHAASRPATVPDAILRELERARATQRLDRAAELLGQLPDRAAIDPTLRQGWATRFDRRALMRYARGDVRGAVADWQFAASLTPEDPALLARLQSAQRELR